MGYKIDFLYKYLVVKILHEYCLTLFLFTIIIELISNYNINYLHKDE